MKLKILYFEDEPEEAKKFAKLVAEVYGTDMQQETEVLLRENNVCWVQDRKAAQQAIRQEQDYKLFILDIMSANGSGLDIIRDIRLCDVYEKAEIWMYSIIPHFEKRAVKELRANLYFSKQNPGELKTALIEMIYARKERWSSSAKMITLGCGNNIKRFCSTDIILVKKVQAGYELYLLGKDSTKEKTEVKMIKFYEEESVIQSILRQGNGPGPVQFMKVNDKCLINVELVVKKSRKSQGTYQIKMQQYPEPITVSRSYAKKLEAILG